MPDTTDATARAVKLTPNELVALRSAIEELEAVLPMTGNDWTGYTGWTLKRPEAKALLKAAKSALGRAHPAARPRPDAATD